jgi:small subunit ribosomal protein S10
MAGSTAPVGESMVMRVPDSTEVTSMSKASSKHVVPTASGGWAVKSSDSTRAVRSFATQAEALQYGQSLAQDAQAELYVHAPDGSVVSKTSFSTEPKIRIRLQGLDDRLIDQSAVEIVQAAKRTGATAKKATALPMRQQRFDILRSVRVRGKATAANLPLEIRSHQKLMDIVSPTDQTVDALKKLDLPKGVDIEITKP